MLMLLILIIIDILKSIYHWWVSLLLIFIGLFYYISINIEKRIVQYITINNLVTILTNYGIFVSM